MNFKFSVCVTESYDIKKDNIETGYGVLPCTEIIFKNISWCRCVKDLGFHRFKPKKTKTTLKPKN